MILGVNPQIQEIDLIQQRNTSKRENLTLQILVSGIFFDRV